MLLISDVKKDKQNKITAEQEKLWDIVKLSVNRSDIPSVTHIDYSARIQTVNQKHNPRFYNILNDLKCKTACPVIINTSFNVRGEPITVAQKMNIFALCVPK